MKIFVVILFILLSLQSWTRADNIKEFEIDGMSIGNSLLDFFTENEINKSTDESYKDKTFITKTFWANSSSIYEVYQISFKRSDKKKIIYSIGGVLNFPLIWAEVFPFTGRASNNSS